MTVPTLLVPRGMETRVAGLFHAIVLRGLGGEETPPCRRLCGPEVERAHSVPQSGIMHTRVMAERGLAIPVFPER